MMRPRKFGVGTLGCRPSEFSGVAGELRLEAAGTGSLLSGDANGDGLADFTIFLMALRIPVATDFIL